MGIKWVPDDLKMVKKWIWRCLFHLLSCTIVFTLKISFKRGVTCHFLNKWESGSKNGHKWVSNDLKTVKKMNVMSFSSSFMWHRYRFANIFQTRCHMPLFEKLENGSKNGHKMGAKWIWRLFPLFSHANVIVLKISLKWGVTCHF